MHKLGALIDIEWRRVTEQALQAKESLLHDALDALTAHIAVLDGDGVITLINAAWQRFAEQNGGGLDCLPGTNYLDVCRQVLSGQDGVEAAAALHGIQQVLDRVQGAFSLVYLCDSPTEARWFEMRVLPLRGPVSGAVVAHEDITARKLTEEARRASEERLRLVLDGANDGFWDWNVATGDLLFSPRWARMLGYDPAELEPHFRTWERLVHPEDLPRVWQAAQPHLFGAAMRYGYEYRMLAKHGDWRWILSRGKVTARDAQGQPLRMTGTHTDVTERRQAVEALHLLLEQTRRHDQQMVALNRMNDLLLCCESCEDAYATIAHGAEVLFAPHAGALAINRSCGPELQRLAAWGAPDRLVPSFTLHDCWALRRGQPHEVAPARDEPDCRHFVERPPTTSLCVPLSVRGSTLGLLHVGTDAALTAEQFQELRTLTVAVGESIKLALSNLRLRETLGET